MDASDELGKNPFKQGFFKHVFNFDADSKHEMMNIVQYVLLALIPVVLLNKTMQQWVPEADEDKGSFELLMEIVLQVTAMFLSMVFIHRIITYIPTYSEEKYAPFSVTNIVLATMMIVLSLQTKLGDKVSILVDRVVDLWEGRQKKANGKKKNQVRVTQPLSGMQQQQQPSQSSGDTTSIFSLPSQMPQSSPNFDQMYQPPMTPLVDAATPGPGMEGMTGGGPIAANMGLSGGSFGSAFAW